MDITQLLTQKREKVQAATEIRDRVYNQQNGEWRGDDEAKFDGLMADAEGITRQIERMAKLDQVTASLDGAPAGEGRRSAPQEPSNRRTAPGRASAEDRALALQGWFARGSEEGQQIITERHQEAARRTGISLEGKYLRMRLGAEPLRSLRQADIEAWQQRLTQVDVVSPDLGGHYTVPDAMMRPLEVALLQFGGMRQVADVIRTSTGAELPNPTMNDTSNKGALLGEGLEHTELDVEFSTLLLGSFKYTSRRVPVSVEFLQDTAIDFAGRIGAILGERIGRITNDHFTTGDGSAKPRGIVTAATSSGVTTASASVVSYDNIMDLKHSVDPAYRSLGARFMFNDTQLKVLKKLKVPQFSGDTAGQSLWRPGLAVGEPDTIDGDAYVINQSMASGSGARSMVYGLLSKYLIRDVRDITLMRLDERYAELGVVAFIAFSRHDGDLLDAGTAPVKYLTQGA